MISSLMAGVVFGLSAGFAPGPLMALVVSQTLRFGVKEGVLVALAPIVTDIPIIILAFVILARLSDVSLFLGTLALAGSIYVFYLAWESFKTAPLTIDAADIQPQSLKKGTLVNLLNPHPYLFWITVGGPLILRLHDQQVWAPWLFLSAFYSLLIGAKILTALIVGRFKDFLSGKVYLGLMRVLGGLLAMFAIMLLKEALQTLF